MAKILVVDDQPDSVRLIGLVLQHNRHEVTTIDNPAQAFLIMRKVHFDMIIADQNMPGMTGQALLERVGVLYPKVARLMLTADPRMKDDKSLPYRVMHKPYKVEELRAVVDGLVAKAVPAGFAAAGAPTPLATPKQSTMVSDPKLATPGANAKLVTSPSAGPHPTSPGKKT